MFELVVIWYTGEKTFHKYNSKPDAERAESGYHVAFGNQISYTYIKEVKSW